MSSMHLSQLHKWMLSSPPIEWAVNQLRELLIGAIRQGPVPQHIAFVMDGNRRFARSHKIETVEGHNLGFEALARILEVCYKSGVKIVTVYAFSIENFKRSKYEVDALMAMAKIKLQQLSQHGELLHKYGASIRVLGQRDLIKPDVLEAVDRAVELTKNNGDGGLLQAFISSSATLLTDSNYTKDPVQESQHFALTFDIPYTIKHIRRHDSISTTTTLHADSPNDGQEGPLYPDPETITSSTIEEHLLTAGNPPLDLLIRTSGVKRLSDFMLWQCHEETEIVFLDTLWPDFDLWSFLPVLVEWQWKQKHIEEKGSANGIKNSKIKVR
ncbi:Dehydrodolichyl diphosphate synthase complex subunit [Lachnellula arida]|uniref:Alkyl transferase n=1 Tax=Lachnellula arida TaxID=1316785 RepID=A0A8T9BS15_9HELO|nr:Dehydrodolichyl diphosphate synthase complex subunit [Lachnellula arida]